MLLFVDEFVNEFVDVDIDVTDILRSPVSFFTDFGVLMQDFFFKKVSSNPPTEVSDRNLSLTLV